MREPVLPAGIVNDTVAFKILKEVIDEREDLAEKPKNKNLKPVKQAIDLHKSHISNAHNQVELNDGKYMEFIPGMILSMPAGKKINAID